MVEVVLGMGLISFGMISVLGLFPVGLNAARDSIAESYAADSADQFLHALVTRLKIPNALGQYQNWEDYGKALPSTKPSGTEPSAWTQWFSDDNTTLSAGGASNEFYRVEQRAAGAAAADFTAIYRVWREEVTYSEYNAGVWQQVTASEDQALAINMEVSWPAHLEYNRRQKSLFRLEVYKPQ